MDWHLKHDFWNWFEIENSWISEGESGLIKRSILELKVFLWSRLVTCYVSLWIGSKTFSLTTLFKHLLTGVILASESVISLYSVYYTIWLYILKMG